MNQSTRPSLLLRIKDQDDSPAWSQFVEIYGPLIYRFGRKKGLQDADATDLMQDVLRQVAQNIAKFNYDPRIGKFRSWLFAVASQAFIQKLRKVKRQPVGSGGTDAVEMLNRLPGTSPNDEVWEIEYRSQLFRWACEQIRDQFNQTTWQAFEKTAVENLKSTDVAEELGISVGSVYVAKSRVLQKLKQKIASVDDSV